MHIAAFYEYSEYIYSINCYYIHCMAIIIRILYFERKSHIPVERKRLPRHVSGRALGWPALYMNFDDGDTAPGCQGEPSTGFLSI